MSVESSVKAGAKIMSWQFLSEFHETCDITMSLTHLYMVFVWLYLAFEFKEQ